MTRRVTPLAQLVVSWQGTHGRHHLPWQGTHNPYQVWLSEVMLQQTQVSTVLRYYARFVARFPDVQTLAAASLDEVLGLWSGLGYYSRARNLHRCAQQIVQTYQGHFPADAQGLQLLPGVGRSTAAAIAAFCYGERVAILDGNVKRVLSRLLGFAQDLSVPAHEQLLWDKATELLPRRDLKMQMPRYTQGLMDLGAMLCTRSQPDCARCPLNAHCVAHQQGRPQDYPVRKRKLKRSAQSLWLLWAHDSAAQVWLERRPLRGVWAGLFCLPVFDSLESLTAALPEPLRQRLDPVPVVTHALTHKDLFLHPVRVRVPKRTALRLPGDWVAAHAWPELGLPAPVRTLLTRPL